MYFLIKLLVVLATSNLVIAANQTTPHCPPMDSKSYVTKNNNGHSTYKNDDKEMLQFIMDHYGITLSNPILDVGAGYGGASYDLLQLGAKTIYANDLSAENVTCMKENITKNFPDKNENIHYLTGDITNRKLFSTIPTNTFGLIYAKNVIHYFTVQQLIEFIFESHNLLQDNGILFLMFENPYLTQQINMTKNIQQDYVYKKPKGDNTLDEVVKHHYQANRLPNDRYCSFSVYEQTPKLMRTPGFPCQMDTQVNGEVQHYQLIMPETLFSILEHFGFNVIVEKQYHNKLGAIVIIARKNSSKT